MSFLDYTNSSEYCHLGSGFSLLHSQPRYATITDRVCSEAQRLRLQEAAVAGNASLFGSGMHPGWCDGMLVSATGICRQVHLVRAVESVNLGPFAADANQDALG
jgi:hypothetical protein